VDGPLVAGGFTRDCIPEARMMTIALVPFGAPAPGRRFVFVA